MTDTETSPRIDALRQWIAPRHDMAPHAARLELAAGDASFRRYFRLWLSDGRTRIVMDAPPDKEDSHPFVAIAEDWRLAGLPVPALHAMDLDAGFIELEDLGDVPLHHRLDGCDTATSLDCYERALALLETLQNRAPRQSLPAYDAALLGRELDLFPEWCLKRLLGIAAPPCWETSRTRLIEMALRQPQVTVHRDFDAMNLMLHDGELWLIDFQDAVRGPLSYDLISLLRGRYCRFPRSRYAAWVEAFRRRAIADGRLTASVDEDTFLFMSDAMAAQRALKVLGIFCRLTLRDEREGYLARLPHFLDHLRDSLQAWPEFAELLGWLDAVFTPALDAELTRRGIRGVAP
nr:phosphotransferase [uncultured Halomonas sp.]